MYTGKHIVCFKISVVHVINLIICISVKKSVFTETGNIFNILIY
jgi:hypothetical protein